MKNINNNPEHRNRYWFTSQIFLRGVFSVWTGYQARGHERIAPGGGLLLINHQSFLDPVLVGLPLKRPISYLARDSLFRVPVLGAFLRRVHVMPINRESAGSSSIREAVARMRQGFLVGIFPEGTRSADGRLGELKPGFVALVRRAGVPVYPVGIAGSHDALPRNAKWLRPKPIRVVFGDPFTAEELSGNAEQITERARQRIADCLEDAESWLRNETPTHESKQAAPREQLRD